MSPLLIILLLAALSLAYGLWAYLDVMKRDAGSQRMQEISGAVAEGAEVVERVVARTLDLPEKAG